MKNDIWKKKIGKHSLMRVSADQYKVKVTVSKDGYIFRLCEVTHEGVCRMIPHPSLVDTFMHPKFEEILTEAISVAEVALVTNY